MRRPPKSLDALIAQNSQEGRIFEKANKAGEELHIVSWRRIISRQRDLMRVRRLWFLVLPPRPRILKDKSFITEHLGGETTL